MKRNFKKHLLDMSKISVAASLLFSTSAFAVDIPQGSKYDSRIQQVYYNPLDVVALYAYVGIGSQAVFAPDEEVIDIGSGFLEGWEVKESNNIIFIKPRSVIAGEGEEQQVFNPVAGEWDTNLLITTNKRLYAFDLFLLDENKKKSAIKANDRVTYRVKFTYPEIKKAEQKRIETAELQKQEAQRLKKRLSLKAPPKNWEYSMQVGDASNSIAPTKAYDDGRFTYLKFPNNSNLPAAFAVSEKGEESLLNSHMEASRPYIWNDKTVVKMDALEDEGVKDVLVIHRVTRSMVLRFGDQVVGIYNDNYDEQGIAPKHGSTVPGISRTIKNKDGSEQ